jgi:NADH pyrophosphatase NudC (nudix superfamily)
MVLLSMESSSSSSSSWVQGEEETTDVSVIKFELPATDLELVNQVFDFIDNSDPDELNHGQMLLKMARKYRFAGYIGSIHYLYAEIASLQEEMEKMKNAMRYLHKPLTWWSWFLKNPIFQKNV